MENKKKQIHLNEDEKGHHPWKTVNNGDAPSYYEDEGGHVHIG